MPQITHFEKLSFFMKIWKYSPNLLRWSGSYNSSYKTKFKNRCKLFIQASKLSFNLHHFQVTLMSKNIQHWHFQCLFRIPSSPADLHILKIIDASTKLTYLRLFPWYRNQLTKLLRKSIDWFLYDQNFVL